MYHPRISISLNNNSTSARKMMNARRQASSSSSQPAFIKYKKQMASPDSFKNNWLSDPATYPIIVTMSGALMMVAGVSVSCLMYNPDVQINPNNRGSVMRPNPDYVRP